MALGASGIALVIAPMASSSDRLTLQRVLPLALIPLAYWQTGQFSAPVHQRLQTALAASDERILRVLKDTGITKSRLLRLDFVFELAYLFVYPMVPSGLAVL